MKDLHILFNLLYGVNFVLQYSYLLTLLLFNFSDSMNPNPITDGEKFI
jgi:hypothetical protein